MTSTDYTDYKIRKRQEDWWAAGNGGRKASCFLVLPPFFLIGEICVICGWLQE
jgi:hypothetical protein